MQDPQCAQGHPRWQGWAVWHNSALQKPLSEAGLPVHQVHGGTLQQLLRGVPNPAGAQTRQPLGYNVSNAQGGSPSSLCVCGLGLCPQSNGDLKRKWTWAVEWLGDELERRPYTGNPQYTYNNWSPPVQSNETSNGYFLERSHSARMTLAKACELCPEEVMIQLALSP